MYRCIGLPDTIMLYLLLSKRTDNFPNEYKLQYKFTRPWYFVT